MQGLKNLLATARHCTAAEKINKTFIVNLLRSCPPLFTDFVPAGPQILGRPVTVCRWTPDAILLSVQAAFILSP
jgi:hypothetical protein